MKIVPMQTPAPIRPRDYSPAHLALIRKTVAKDTNKDEFDLFMEISRRAGLDPFRKQIYCFVYNKDKPDKRSVSFVTGIDGFRACADRNGNYRPDDEEPEWTYKEELKDKDTNPHGIEKATVKAFKMDTKGEWHTIKATAYWEEFAPLKEIWEPDETGRRQPTGKFVLDRSGNWPKMGRHMLAKCSEAQVLRKGWPEDLSGINVFEEMDHVNLRDVTATEAADRAEEEARLVRANVKDAVPFVWEYGGSIEFTPLGQVADRIMSFVRDNDAAQVDWFRTTNAEGLRQFWALSPNDALEVKKHMETALTQPDMLPDEK